MKDVRAGRNWRNWSTDQGLDKAAEAMAATIAEGVDIWVGRRYVHPSLQKASSF
jgi:hypothetical protein